MVLFTRFKTQKGNVARDVPPTASSTEKTRTFIDDAEWAAEVVQSSITSGDYSAIDKELTSIIQSGKNRVQYVFPPFKNENRFLTTALRILLAGAFLYIALISLSTIVLSSYYRPYGIIGLSITIIVLILNLFPLFRKRNTKKFDQRYRSYAEILRYRMLVFTEDLSEMTKTPVNTVIQDLKKAVKSKLIPEGHFSSDNSIFMVSDRIYEDYLRRPKVYRQFYLDRSHNRSITNEQSAEIDELLQKGNAYVDKIRASNALIKDEEISNKLYRLERTVSAIFSEVTMDPAQAKKLSMFMNYYLPTTEKLLDAYIQLETAPYRSDNSKKTQSEISHALDVINTAYGNLLQKFFDEQALQLSVEISVLESMMKQKGLV